MVQDHMNDLNVYLSQDEKGRRIPTYLVKLAEQVSTKFAGVQKELDSLGSNVDHVRRIITSQQGLAETQVLLEPIHLEDVIEHALAINRDTLERGGIAVVREYAALPATMSDRHQLLQIIVNLINNAIHVMNAVPGHPHRLTVTIGYHPESRERAEIQVRDTGLGIKPDNFKRLFTQGFTTREGGQGLGLHSRVLRRTLARGPVRCKRGGEGQGATFTLDLPLAQVAMAA